MNSVRGGHEARHGVGWAGFMLSQLSDSSNSKTDYFDSEYILSMSIHLRRFRGDSIGYGNWVCIFRLRYRVFGGFDDKTD